MQLDWILIGEILYLVVLMIVCLRVIYDTRSSTKTLAYLLLIIFIPIVGIFIYFSFGVNYRRKKMYSKKLLLDAALESRLEERIQLHSQHVFAQGAPAVVDNSRMFRYLLKEGKSALTAHNAIHLLINGE